MADDDPNDDDSDDSSDKDEDTNMDTTNDTTHLADANTLNLVEAPFLPSCTSDSTEPAPILPLQTLSSSATIPNMSMTVPLDNDDDLPFPVPVLGNEHQH